MKKKKYSHQQQIGIPKGCQQPRTRSHGPRRRTDFSALLSSSPSSFSHSTDGHRSHRGSTFEFSSCKNGCSSITTATVDQGCHASLLGLEEEIPKRSLMRCSVSLDGGHKCPFFNRSEACIDVESIAQSAPPETFDNWNNGLHITDHISTFSSAEVLSCTPNKSASQVAESGDVWIVPGRVVWAKKPTLHIWWPAEVLGERANTNDQTVGSVLVQFFGSHDYAWVDPVGDLSHFEDCFEERSCSPTEMFQDALTRALQRKQHLTSCKQWEKSPDLLMNSNQRDQLSDKWNASSSSKIEDDYHGGGRSKRKRKPKVHFDEVIFPVESKKKARRLRIMRYLGLVAPPGSPFTLASHIRTAYKSCKVLDV